MSTDQVRTVRLYGRLGAKFGRVHRLAVRSAREAAQALSVLIPGFEAYLMQSKDRGEGYAVFYDMHNLGEEELDGPSGTSEIRFAPVVLGSKRAGVFQIVVGVVILAVTFIADYFTAGGFSAATGGMGYTIGWGMIVGGVVQLLTPVPKGRTQDKPENQASAVFNGAVNTQAQGNPVPVLYGELIVGSAVISAGINAEDQAIVPSGNPAIGSGGGGGGGSAPWYGEYTTDPQ